MDIIPQLNQIAEQIATMYRDSLKSDDHYASGKLAAFQKDIYMDDNSIRVYFLLEDYWKEIEEGQKPNRPDINAIKRWIRIKKIIPNTTYKGVPSVGRMAYFVCNKIEKRGTVGTHNLQRTTESIEFETLKQQIMDLIVTKYSTEIQEQLEKTFNLQQ